VASRHELTAAVWARIAPLLPARETRGTYYVDHRCVFNGMLYRHATGCTWRELADAGRIDWELWCIGGSHVRAHRVAAGARENRPQGEPADHALWRSRGGCTTKLHLVTNGHGLPLAVALSVGQAHESVHASGASARSERTPIRTRPVRSPSPRAARSTTTP
jgi:transposase